MCIYIDGCKIRLSLSLSLSIYIYVYISSSISFPSPSPSPFLSLCLAVSISRSLSIFLSLSLNISPSISISHILYVIVSNTGNASVKCNSRCLFLVLGTVWDTQALLPMNMYLCVSVGNFYPCSYDKIFFSYRTSLFPHIQERDTADVVENCIIWICVHIANNILSISRGSVLITMGDKVCANLFRFLNPAITPSMYGIFKPEIKLSVIYGSMPAM